MRRLFVGRHPTESDEGGVTETPLPMTPADADLQDFPFMPLHVARLRDSDLASEEAPEACWYAVLLWAAAWHQIPAGSLPDNEIVLTRLVGLGRDVKTFRKHRAGALRGFVLCGDGRLYHPVVSEQVVAAWQGKLQQRWRTDCARIKKANQRNGTDLPTPTFEQFLAGLSLETVPPCPAPVPGDNEECPSGNALQEKGKGTGTGTGTGRLLEGGPRKRGARLPEDWAPGPGLVAYGMELGFAEAKVIRIAERFRLHWHSSANRNAIKVDWDKAFQGWLRDDAEKLPKPQAAARPRSLGPEVF